MLGEVFLGKACVPETRWNLLNRFSYDPDPPTLVAKASLLYSLGVFGHCCRRICDMKNPPPWTQTT